jgi:hypothetical protein
VDPGALEGPLIVEYIPGDCPNTDENNEYYIDGTVDISSLQLDQNGNLTYKYTDDSGAVTPGSIEGVTDPYVASTTINVTADIWWETFSRNLFSNWSWGVRQPNQTYRQCLAQNSSNYSVAGALNQQGELAQLALGNDVATSLFGNASEGRAGLLVATGAEKSLGGGAGKALTAGRRTASIFDLNLSGTTGPAPRVLGKTGAKGAIETAAAYKLAADVGATIALAGGCLTHP